MRHLFITNDFPPKMGGIESYLTTLCRGFGPDQVAVVAPTRDGHEEVDRRLHYRVFRVDGTYLRATKRVHTAIADAVEAFEPDHIHFLAALPLGRLGPRLRGTYDVPFTVIAHGSGEILVPARLPLARRALKRVLSSADLVLPVSRFTEAAVLKLTRGRAKTHVFHPTVDVERFSLEVSGGAVRTRHELAGRFVVLFVSRLVKRKGAHVLIEAMARTEGAMAVIVGGGPERKALERLVVEHEVSDRVLFAGHVPDADLPSYYAAADLFCMPCSDRYGGLDTEGFGIVYIEAQASGVPVIAGVCGGSVEAVEDGRTGYLLEDPSPDDVAGLIARFQDDPTMCATFGAAGRHRCETEFAPVPAAERLEAALSA